MRRRFSKEDVQMANRYMKKCWASLIIKEMQIRTTIKISPMRMTVIKKTRNKKYLWGCEEKGTLLPCWSKCKLCSHYGRQSGDSAKKLKIELLYDAAFPHLGIYQEEMKAITRKDTSTVFSTTLLIIAKTWNQPKCPSMDEWVGRWVCVCVCLCVLFCLNTELTESENKLMVARGRGRSELVRTSSYKGTQGF